MIYNIINSLQHLVDKCPNVDLGMNCDKANKKIEKIKRHITRYMNQDLFEIIEMKMRCI